MENNNADYKLRKALIEISALESDCPYELNSNQVAWKRAIQAAYMAANSCLFPYVIDERGWPTFINWVGDPPHSKPVHREIICTPSDAGSLRVFVGKVRIGSGVSGYVEKEDVDKFIDFMRTLRTADENKGQGE